MDEAYDDRRIREQDIEGLAQHHGPGESAHQRIRPEGQDDEEEDRLAPAPLYIFGEAECCRIADDEAYRRDIEAEFNRAPSIVPVDLLGEEVGIVLQREPHFLAAEWRGGEEAEIEHGGERQQYRRREPKIGGSRQGKDGAGVARESHIMRHRG